MPSHFRACVLLCLGALLIVNFGILEVFCITYLCCLFIITVGYFGSFDLSVRCYFMNLIASAISHMISI
jgi:hypothetical protein